MKQMSEQRIRTLNRLFSEKPQIQTAVYIFLRMSTASAGFT